MIKAVIFDLGNTLVRESDGQVFPNAIETLARVGYIGVARVFDYFMREEKMGVKGLMEIPSGKKGPRRDFYTEMGKTMGEEGLNKARDFWKELRHELKEEERTVKKIIQEYEGD